MSAGQDNDRYERGIRVPAAIDISGDRFGKLVAVRPTGKRSAGSVVWECHCDCGNVYEASASNLVAGSAVNCGCEPVHRSNAARELSAGQRFGKLIAIDMTGDYSGGSPLWRCMCDCDRVVRVTAADLMSGRANSCGQCEGVD